MNDNFVKELDSEEDNGNLIQRLLGRAQFLRNRKEIKTPELLEAAAKELQSNFCEQTVTEKVSFVTPITTLLEDNINARLEYDIIVWANEKNYLFQK